MVNKSENGFPSPTKKSSWPFYCSRFAVVVYCFYCWSVSLQLPNPNWHWKRRPTGGPTERCSVRVNASIWCPVKCRRRHNQKQQLATIQFQFPFQFQFDSIWFASICFGFDSMRFVSIVCSPFWRHPARKRGKSTMQFEFAFVFQYEICIEKSKNTKRSERNDRLTKAYPNWLTLLANPTGIP